MKKYFLFCVAVFLISGILASYNLGNPSSSVEQNYSQSGKIRGYFNMSFNQEIGDSLFSDSIGNSIKLIDLLKSDSRHNYSCTPNSCEKYYSATNAQTTKTIVLNTQQNSLKGLKIQDEIQQINSVGFK